MPSALSVRARASTFSTRKRTSAIDPSTSFVIPSAPSRWTRSAGSAPSGSGTTRSSSDRPAATRSARSIASWPALSASSASATVDASFASSPTWSSVSAVPMIPTALRSPAWCSAITSV